MASDFLDILSQLHDHHVEFVIVGGVAASLHGSTRVTFELNVVPCLAPVLAASGRPGWTQKQSLMNVVDLGNGRTGIVAYIKTAASRGIRLVEYKEGAAIRDMRILQSVVVGD